MQVGQSRGKGIMTAKAFHLAPMAESTLRFDRQITPVNRKGRHSLKLSHPLPVV